MRLWPDTIVGRTLSLLIGITLLLIIGSAYLLYDERQDRFDERNLFYFLKRVTTLVSLIGDANDEERQRIIKRLEDQQDVITLTDHPLIPDSTGHPLERKIKRTLRYKLQMTQNSSVRVQIKFEEGSSKGWNKKHRRRELDKMSISIKLWDESWLNIQTERFERPPPWANKTLQMIGLLLILVIIIGLFIARRMARPITQLAAAAESFGLGQPQPPLPEKGSREVRDTIRAFNNMQQRLQKHISDRSQMLAAVSHDLRTPITTLRLRAEYIEDVEMREKTLATLAEMEAILSDTLSFARDEAADEKSRSTDLSALLTSLIDDHTDLGGELNYVGPDRLIIQCRPTSLKRAINNIIDNALKYGKSATVELIEHQKEIEIRISDQGPGIAEEYHHEVFTPFYRLERSRNRDTGGTGLGLAVAKTIIHAHGGKINLQNNTEAGLLVTIKLPQ